MCVCESDLIKMKLHLITKRYYPGIKYNEAVLGQFADDLGIAFEKEIRDLDEAKQADLAAKVYDRLAEATPPPEAPESQVEQRERTKTSV